MSEDAEQLRVQLAGCAVAALGHATGSQLAQRGDYGWSQSYQDVLDLRRRYDDLSFRHDRMADELTFIVSYLAHYDQDANHAWMVRRIRAAQAGKDPSTVQGWLETDGVPKPRPDLRNMAAVLTVARDTLAAIARPGSVGVTVMAMEALARIDGVAGGVVQPPQPDWRGMVEELVRVLRFTHPVEHPTMHAAYLKGKEMLGHGVSQGGQAGDQNGGSGLGGGGGGRAAVRNDPDVVPVLRGDDVPGGGAGGRAAAQALSAASVVPYGMRAHAGADGEFVVLGVEVQVPPGVSHADLRDTLQSLLVAQRTSEAPRSEITLELMRGYQTAMRGETPAVVRGRAGFPDVEIRRAQGHGTDQDHGTGRGGPRTKPCGTCVPCRQASPNDCWQPRVADASLTFDDALAIAAQWVRDYEGAKDDKGTQVAAAIHVALLAAKGRAMVAEQGPRLPVETWVQGDPNASPVGPDWARRRVEAMAQRPGMFASTRECFFMQLWLLMEVSGADADAVRYHLKPKGCGAALPSPNEPPDAAFAEEVTRNAIALLDAIPPVTDYVAIEDILRSLYLHDIGPDEALARVRSLRHALPKEKGAGSPKGPDANPDKRED